MSKINEICDLLGLQIKSNNERICAEGVLSTGEFGKTLFDYGRGLLEVTIYYSNYLNPDLVISISTIDDGVWQAYAMEPLSKKQVDIIFKELKEQYPYKLPSEEELNSFLKTYGVYGTYTG